MNLIPKKPDPAPVKFPQANFTYTRPDSMSEEQCGSLPCFRNNILAISCWRFPLRDRLRMLFTGVVWLTVLGSGHPPVSLAAETPFPKEEKPKGKPAILWPLIGIGLGLGIALSAALNHFVFSR